MSIQARPAGTEPAATAPAGRRLVPLDGVRGLAALVVVVHHCLLTAPALAGQYWGSPPAAPSRGSATWWLTSTPLHLAWAGTEAVIVFFVLSGTVLTRPYLGRPAPTGTWRGYYARRLLRLYVPVLVALGLAQVVVRCFPRVPTPGLSWWSAAHVGHASLRALAHEALFLEGSFQINTVLWSLRYEVAFSLLLPLVVLVARRWPPALWLNLPLSLGLVGLGQLSTDPFLQWLPYLGVGVALAVGWEDLRRAGERVQRSSAGVLVWCLLCAATPVALLAVWWFRSASLTSPREHAVAMSLVALGAVLLSFLAVSCPAVQGFFSSRLLQWAGRISFSLYLVHEPIVVSVSTLAGPGKRGVATTLVVGGAIAICVAMVFHRLVERPSQRWARAAGRLLDGGRRDALPARQQGLPPVPTALPHPRHRLPAVPGRPPAGLESVR